MIKIEVFGRRKKLLSRIKEITHEHEESMNKKHKKDKEVNKDAVIELLRMKSTN